MTKARDIADLNVTILDSVELNSDATDTTNVTSSGALMDSELTAIASVKALNQGVATTDSPAFAGLTLSGVPTAPTAASGTGTTQIATTAYTDAAITALIGGAPSTLDTLNEIAAAVSDDPDYVGTVNAALALKAPKASPTFTGTVTANAGVVVDNFTLDGTTLALSSGSMTLDSASQIILDADGGLIQLKDGGTEFAQLKNSSSDLQIISIASDKDIIFRGNDGGSYINALTLDMSAAGAATFNAGATFGGGITGNGDLTVGNSYISNSYARFANLRVDNNAYMGSQNTPQAVQFTTAGSVGFGYPVTMASTLSVTGNVGISGYASVNALASPDGTSIVFPANTGYVGVGTGSTAPATRLHVLGNSNLAASLTLHNTAPSTDNIWRITPFYNSGDLGFLDGDTEILRLNANGLALKTDTARLLIEEADGTNIAFVGDLTGAGQGGAFYYNHGGTATIQLKSYEASTIGHGLNVGGTVHASQTYSAPTNGISADTVGIFSKSNTANGNANVSVLSRSSGEARLYLGDETDENKWAIISKSYGGGLSFESAGTERLRIATNARQTINGSATATGHGNFVGEVGASYKALMFEHTVGGGEVGSIVTTSSSTSYGVGSDYRLKENVVPMTGSIDRVKALKPSRFNFIIDADKTVDGFLAHEAQAVVPECVTGTKDAMKDEEYEVTAAVYEDVITPAVEAVDAVVDEDGVVITEAVEAVAETTESVLVTEAVMGSRSVPDYQGIDQAKLVPLLTAALQEAITQIESLTARIAALEE